MAELLEIKHVSKRYRGLVANQDVNLTVASGSMRCIIGPNGAGKTTLISLVSGHQTPTTGEIWFKGENVTHRSVPQRSRLGIVRKFQTPTLYNNLSTYKNLELAVLGSRCAPKRRHTRILQVLELVRMTEFIRTSVSRLSHGQKQWLEIGLLIANDAELLLLDEPTAGMTAEETHATGELVRGLVQDLHLSAMIIEHDINFIRDLRAPVTVLHLGAVLAEGEFDQIQQNETVRKVYLGEE
ncbi:ATP-binding cassette domain-containing protein [Phormidium sp. CLA17]|uniref:ATP-binding cassette domain-containing protein n=1 Tax=Leptolyngbya sp. Cla-17 TaxID=2803751 RepID=UPI001491D743|nr:ATP-binding cassette domain-containing protein [Leptolyngbya sp. Cla-17]MBM0744003.1 ATP-binding cassette domain-containing protein [Leptolyngbya sp. Cla-17]